MRRKKKRPEVLLPERLLGTLLEEHEYTRRSGEPSLWAFRDINERTQGNEWLHAMRALISFIALAIILVVQLIPEGINKVVDR